MFYLDKLHEDLQYVRELREHYNGLKAFATKIDDKKELQENIQKINKEIEKTYNIRGKIGEKL
ncbi:MAG: hypothetical protein N3D10_03740 [Candidatus Micrarchaeota archaeon]|nr:hypothetical protein [Candidatus Micrarchaeota archaeon]